MARSSANLKSKSHFEILDGLRGVAALTVVLFHTFEANNGGSRFRQIINHGYLAVDFFFLLSGFVVAYAYDDRWGKMTQWNFYKRRLVRLQPMVIMGNLIGAALFYFGRSSIFPLIATTPLWKMLLAMLVGFTLIPLLPSMDIRGWDEMHPLDGPAWSLFFEYVANILYAVGIRKLPRWALSILVLLSAGLLFCVAVFGGHGDVIGGWAVNQKQLTIGFARLLYPFFAGVLLMRLGKRIHLRGAFAVCSLLLVIVLALPRFGGSAHLWVNGLYEFLVITLVFPIIVAAGAGDSVNGVLAMRLCRFSGAISYPLYITHYGFIYIYTGWVVDHSPPLAERTLAGALLFVVSIAVAYACLKLYDEPVRAWLTRRFLTRAPSPQT